MEFDALFYTTAVVAVFIAGVSKGGFGSGAAFVASPLLALVIEPQVAIGLMLPLLMAMDVAAVRAYWRKWSLPDARVLVLGAIPGIALAVALHSVTNADMLRFLIGSISILFVAFQIGVARGWITPRDRPFGPKAGLFAGAVAGFTSFVSHAGGPPALIYLLPKKLDKTTFQATTVIAFWWINLLKIGPYAALGFLSRDVIVPILWLLPVAILGIFTGVQAHKRLDDRMFFAVAYVLLTLAGSKLIFDALT